MKRILPLLLLFSLILIFVLEIAVLVYQVMHVSSAEIGSNWIIPYYLLGIVSALFFIYLPRLFGRVCSSNARFALDALPGKHMQIEYAFKNNQINRDEVIDKMNHLQTELDYLGALDGISRISSVIIRIALCFPFLACLCTIPFRSFFTELLTIQSLYLVPKGLIISGFVFLLLYALFETLLILSSRFYEP